MTETFEKRDPSRDLNDREDLRRYQEACTEQDPGDSRLIRAALNDIARAHSVTGRAPETGMTRVGIYKALAPEGNPTFATFMRDHPCARNAGAHHGVAPANWLTVRLSQPGPARQAATHR